MLQRNGSGSLKYTKMEATSGKKGFSKSYLKMLILAQLTIKQMFRRGNVSSMDNYVTERPDLHAGGQNIIKSKF
jgi:hypothetical protein